MCYELPAGQHSKLAAAAASYRRHLPTHFGRSLYANKRVACEHIDYICAQRRKCAVSGFVARADRILDANYGVFGFSAAVHIMRCILKTIMQKIRRLIG